MDGVTVCEPDAPPPDTRVMMPSFNTHEVAFVELQDRIVDPPRVIDVGLLFNEAVGVGTGTTQLSPLTSYPAGHPHTDALSIKLPLLQYLGLIVEH